MPFYWIRVPNGVAPKVRACMGDDHSKRRFADCVGRIVDADGGRVESLWFEANGKWAHAHVYSDTPEQKRDILLDLEADQVIDLYSPDEIDELIAKRFDAD
jgi:hypothetical protein